MVGKRFGCGESEMKWENKHFQQIRLCGLWSIESARECDANCHLNVFFFQKKISIP